MPMRRPVLFEIQRVLILIPFRFLPTWVNQGPIFIKNRTVPFSLTIRHNQIIQLINPVNHDKGRPEKITNSVDEGQMGNTWITDLRHFLDDDGSLADMPRPACRLTKYLGQIVKAVTTRKRNTLATGVRCRRRPGRRPCSGEIIAFIEEQRAISWSCPACKDNGVISGWEGTIWDWSVSA